MTGGWTEGRQRVDVEDAPDVLLVVSVEAGMAVPCRVAEARDVRAEGSWQRSRTRKQRRHEGNFKTELGSGLVPCGGD